MNNLMMNFRMFLNINSSFFQHVNKMIVFFDVYVSVESNKNDKNDDIELKKGKHIVRLHYVYECEGKRCM